MNNILESEPKEFIEINFTKRFVRQYKKVDKGLQMEIKEKVELFKNRKNHERLKVHKLRGSLDKFYSFSVDSSIGILFEWINGVAVLLLEVGDHDVYKK